jgi:hypothetical protein
MGCPLEWNSELRTAIVTSTMGAVRIALRVAIPFMDVCRYVTNGFNVSRKHLVTFKNTVYDDNQGALTLAKLDQGRATPRSKLYAIKHHWFWS